MGIFARFEKKVEGAVNGVFARAFKGDVQPVEIRRGAQQVERQPLRGAVADAWELAELGHQALDGRGEQLATSACAAGGGWAASWRSRGS